MAAPATREQKGPGGPRAAVDKVLRDPKHPLHHLNLRLFHSRDDGDRVEFFGVEPDPASTFRVLFVVAEVAQAWVVERQRVCIARAWPTDAPIPGPPGSAYEGTGDIRDGQGVEFGRQPDPGAVAPRL